MAEKGRVAILVEYGMPYEIREYDLPDPEPGAIVLKITQAGICGSDLHLWRGDPLYGPLPPDGLVMGHEGTGVVYKLGEGVTTDSLGTPIKEGDRLLHSGIFPCYRCHMCLRDDTNLCVNNIYATHPAGEHPYFTGTFSDFFYLPPRHPAFRVPDELPDDVLAPINCATGTVTQGLINADCHQGQYVVIQGAGGLGLNATAMAKSRGADPVIVLDRLKNRLRMAEEFGADYTVNIEEYNTPEARVERVKELTKGRGADLVIELAGRVELVPEGIDMLSHGGTFLEIGNTFRGREVSIDPSKLLPGKRLMGSAICRPNILPTVLDYMVRNQDKVPFHKIVSHKFKLADINEALNRAEWDQRQTDVTRAVLVP